MGANQQYKSSVFADYLTEAGTNNSRLLEISQATGMCRKAHPLRLRSTL